MKQRVISVNGVSPPTGGKWSGKLARQALSNSVADLDPGIFNHSASGELIQTRSPLRFGGGVSGFNVTLIHDIEPDTEASLLRGFMQYALDNDGSLDVKQISCDLKETVSSFYYHGVIVFGKSNSFNKGHDGKEGYWRRIGHETNTKIVNDPAYRTAYLKKEIARGIARQFHAYVADKKMLRSQAAGLGRLDQNGEVLLSSIEEFIDSIEIKDVSMMSPEMRYLPRAFVRFTMPLHLEGNWAVGRMNNKGVGRIYYDYTRNKGIDS